VFNLFCVQNLDMEFLPKLSHLILIQAFGGSLIHRITLRTMLLLALAMGTPPSSLFHFTFLHFPVPFLNFPLRFWFATPSQPIGLTAAIGGFYPASYNPSFLPLLDFYNNTAHSSADTCTHIFILFVVSAFVLIALMLGLYIDDGPDATGHTGVGNHYWGNDGNQNVFTKSTVCILSF
jgi:hypothetical protein